MPIHDLGYRSWNGVYSFARGKFRATLANILCVGMNSLKLAWRSTWLRRIMIVAWAPAIGWGGLFFVYEKAREAAVSSPGTDDGFVQFIMFALRESSREPRVIPTENDDRTEMNDENSRQGGTRFRRGGRRSATANAVADAIRAFSLDRHKVWRSLVFNFFRSPQAFLLMLVVGIAAPPLISRDAGSKAYLIYFSRPITPLEYILGKAFPLCVFLALITTLPAIGMYLWGLMLSPSEDVLQIIQDTWDLPFRVMAASVLLIVPTTLLSLALSSLTTRSRVAGFLWFALWILGLVASLAVMSTEQVVARTQHQSPPEFGRSSLFSLFLMLGEVQAFVFGIRVDAINVGVSLFVLVTISVVSFVVVHRRVVGWVRS